MSETGTSALLRVWLVMEDELTKITGEGNNPFHFLGAISVFFLWAILVSGIYLFIFYRISAAEAYASVEAITASQWYAGGVMRSIHRYASDCLVISMLLHAVRAFVFGLHKRQFARMAWVTGVAAVPLIVAGGIFGYVLVWDDRAHLLALISSDLIEKMPLLGMPVGLTFLSPERLTDQFFYIVLFIHIAAIVAVAGVIMLHIIRIKKAVVTPPKAIIAALCITMALLAAINPAVSSPQANLFKLPAEVPFDWFYFFPYAIVKELGSGLTVFALTFVTVFMAALPWLLPAAKKPALAEVILENCNGCGLCRNDCPYEAVSMQKRTDGANFDEEAVVLPQRCAGCGLCVGACAYGAVEMAELKTAEVNGLIKKHAKEVRKDGASVIVFYCSGSPVEAAALKEFKWARAVSVPCAGMIQPAMIALSFEAGFDGVMVAMCPESDCRFRLGAEWFSARIARTRRPEAPAAIDGEKVFVFKANEAGGKTFLSELNEFRNGLPSRKGDGR